MEVDPPASSSLSPTDRRRRNRESEAIRDKARASEFGLGVVLHAAMLVHKELGNNSAAAIHQKLIGIIPQ